MFHKIINEILFVASKFLAWLFTFLFALGFKEEKMSTFATKVANSNYQLLARMLKIKKQNPHWWKLELTITKSIILRSTYSIISIIRPGRLSYNYFFFGSYGTFNRDSLQKFWTVRLIQTVRLSIILIWELTNVQYDSLKYTSFCSFSLSAEKELFKF